MTDIIQNEIERIIEERGGKSIVGPPMAFFIHPAEGGIAYKTYASSVGIAEEGAAKPCEFDTADLAATNLTELITKDFSPGQMLVWRRLPQVQMDERGKWRATARLAFCPEADGVAEPND